MPQKRNFSLKETHTVIWFRDLLSEIVRKKVIILTLLWNYGSNLASKIVFYLKLNFGDSFHSKVVHLEDGSRKPQTSNSFFTELRF